MPTTAAVAWTAIRGAKNEDKRRKMNLDIESFSFINVFDHLSNAMTVAGVVNRCSSKKKPEERTSKKKKISKVERSARNSKKNI